MSGKSIQSVSSHTDSPYGERNSLKNSKKEKSGRLPSRSNNNEYLEREKEKEREKERARLREIEREKEKNEQNMQKLLRSLKHSRDRAEAEMAPDATIRNILRVSFKCQSKESS